MAISINTWDVSHQLPARLKVQSRQLHWATGEWKLQQFLRDFLRRCRVSQGPGMEGFLGMKTIGALAVEKRITVGFLKNGGWFEAFLINTWEDSINIWIDVLKETSGVVWNMRQNTIVSYFFRTIPIFGLAMD